MTDALILRRWRWKNEPKNMCRELEIITFFQHANPLISLNYFIRHSCAESWTPILTGRLNTENSTGTSLWRKGKRFPARKREPSIQLEKIGKSRKYPKFLVSFASVQNL